MCFSEVFDTKQLEDDGLCWTYGKKKKKLEWGREQTFLISANLHGSTVGLHNV